MRCSNGHGLGPDTRERHRCDVCRSKGTAFRCEEGCDYDVCLSCGDPRAAQQEAVTKLQEATQGTDITALNLAVAQAKEKGVAQELIEAGN